MASCCSRSLEKNLLTSASTRRAAPSTSVLSPAAGSDERRSLVDCTANSVIESVPRKVMHATAPCGRRRSLQGSACFSWGPIEDCRAILLRLGGNAQCRTWSYPLLDPWSSNNAPIIHAPLSGWRGKQEREWVGSRHFACPPYRYA